jgi:hypothetical protein
MARVYLESSFVSYLTAAPRESRDPIAAAHQQITIEWWFRRRADFDLVVSQVVIDEVQTGDPTLAKSRLEIVDSLPRLRVTDQVTALALNILSKGLLPQKAFPDALHIATATFTRSTISSPGTASTSPTSRFSLESQISVKTWASGSPLSAPQKNS